MPRPRRFTPVTHRTGGWVGPRAAENLCFIQFVADGGGSKTGCLWTSDQTTVWDFSVQTRDKIFIITASGRYAMSPLRSCRYIPDDNSLRSNTNSKIILINLLRLLYWFSLSPRMWATKYNERPQFKVVTLARVTAYSVKCASWFLSRSPMRSLSLQAGDSAAVLEDGNWQRCSRICRCSGLCFSSQRHSHQHTRRIIIYSFPWKFHKEFSNVRYYVHD